MDDLEEMVNDSAFMNRIQGEVNGRIQEIQKVTKLDRIRAAKLRFRKSIFG